MSVPCWHCGSPTEVATAAGQAELRRCTVTDCFSNFRGPGVASLLLAEQHKCNLQEDAERLEELRGAYADLVEKFKSGMFVANNARARQVEILIAVYEECQARGRTFGGLR